MFYCNNDIPFYLSLLQNKRMDPIQIIKAVKQYSFNLSQELQQYIEVQSGKAFSQEAKFQQVEIEKSSSSEDGHDNKEEGAGEEYEDFHLEVDEGNVDVGSSIKTYQFNSGMFAPAKSMEKVVESPLEVEIEVQECFGFNSKEKSTCTMLGTNYFCMATGCSLILCSLKKEQKLKPYKIFQEHVYEVSRLYYSPKHKLLVSGSKGLKPQLILWSFEQSQSCQQSTLKFINKFKLSRKSEGIGLICLVKGQRLFCTDSVSIHRGNQVRCFDVEAGNQLKMRKKWDEKLLDWCVDGEEKYVYVATSGGIVQFTSFNETLEVKDIGDKRNGLISISCYKKYLITGDQAGNVEILTMDGKTLSKACIHKGLVFNKYILSDKTLALLITSGTEDSQVKIHTLQQKQASLALNTVETLQLTSYCTSISCTGQQNILLGLRDGSITVYDAKNKTRKLQRTSLISCMQSHSLFLIYNCMNEKIMFMPSKDILYQLTADKCAKNMSKQPQTSLTELRKNMKCMAIFQDKVLQICGIKDHKYSIQVNSMVNLASKPEFEGKFEIQKEGKPKIVRFNTQIAAIGTKGGHIGIYLFKKPSFFISSEHHNGSIQDIIFQEGNLKLNQPFYIKTISGSELFYWQILLNDKQITIKPINKAGPLKNLNWCSICKYCWDTKPIWEEMTHFQDIKSVAKVADKYLCASMNTGMLRIYRCPASKNNFIETKLFPDSFNLLTCGKNNQYLLCQKNCSFLLLKLRPIQN